MEIKPQDGEVWASVTDPARAVIVTGVRDSVGLFDVPNPTTVTFSPEPGTTLQMRLDDFVQHFQPTPYRFTPKEGESLNDNGH